MARPADGGGGNDVTTPLPTFTTTGMELRRVLKNALLFCGRDRTLPMLRCVRIEYDPANDGEGVLAVATDRYRLSWERIGHPGLNRGTPTDCPAFAFTMERDDAEWVAGALRAPLEQVTLTAPGEDGKYTVLAGDQAWTFAAEDGTFPSWRNLRPGDAAEVEGIAFNPVYLADLARVRTADHDRGTPVLFEFHGPNKPALARFADGPTVLLMPVRAS